MPSHISGFRLRLKDFLYFLFYFIIIIIIIIFINETSICNYPMHELENIVVFIFCANKNYCKMT